MDIDYSVIIRTTGKAGEKYAKLLASIDRLVPSPKEVIVVLPQGYALPQERLGWETFFFSPKGMVIQRMTGIQRCHTQYALVCDDDVQFSPDFVRKLHKPLEDGMGGLSIAPLYSFFPQKGLRTMIDAVLGSGIPTVFHKNRYCSVLRTTGYSYNRRLHKNGEYGQTQSAAWTCFYANVEALRAVDFEVEQQWLDAHGYSALDDQTMFYKAWLRGIKTIVVTDASYEHLDARTSTRENREPVLFSRMFNRIVFWHRYIYLQENSLAGKCWAGICFGYYQAANDLYAFLRGVPAEEKRIKNRARKEAKAYLRSDSYKKLPPVKKTTK